MQKLKIYLLTALILIEAPLISCVNKAVQKQVKQTVCPCEYNFDPVCGCDGIIYLNKCLLDCYNNANKKKDLPAVTMAEDKATCSECVCQEIYQPVCSLDGDTYNNECELSCVNIQRIKGNKPLVYLAYRTACIGSPCDCSTVASPVCGNDNVLYRNLCVLNCTNSNSKAQGLAPIKFKNVGACLDACQCPDVKNPVCGSDGQKYDNPCEIACQNRKMTCSLSPSVTVSPKDVCEPCKCPKIYTPVCATDGFSKPRTFQNICEFNCENKRLHNSCLNIIAFGACPNCFCADIYSPVCGTDCKTYKNECELRWANDCREKGELVISVFHSGPCQVKDCDCSHCPNEYAPMCGSDGTTYWNLCWLNCNSECCKKQKLAPLSLSARGSCSL